MVIALYELKDGWIAAVSIGEQAAVTPIGPDPEWALQKLREILANGRAPFGAAATAGDQEDGAEPESLTEHEGGNDPVLSARAAAAYRAYSHRVKYRSVTGERLPVWDGLGQEIRNAWRAAAAAAVERP